MKKPASAVIKATKVTKSANPPKPSAKTTKATSNVNNTAGGSKTKVVPKSFAIRTEGLRDSGDDTDPNNPPAAVACKSPKKAGMSNSNAKAISHTGDDLDVSSDADADGESDAVIELTTAGKNRSPRMVVEIPHFARRPATSSSLRPIPPVARPQPVTRPVPVTRPTPVAPPPPVVFTPPPFNFEDPPNTRNDSPAECRDDDQHGHTEADSDTETYRGGRFTQDQVALIRSKCDAFFGDLDALAKEWKRSVDSVRRVALATAPSKSQRNGNAWNAFQFMYRQSHPNTDPSGMYACSQCCA